MKEKLEQILKEFNNDIHSADDAIKAEALRVAYLGKKGKVTEVMPMLKNVAPESRKEVGFIVNQVKNEIETKVLALIESIKQAEVDKQIANGEKIDITLPINLGVGSLHPRTIIQKELEDIFISMGFNIEDGPELETEFNNFDAVNLPKHHPARDMQDTFWLNNGQVLRTQTSALQNKLLIKYKGPFKAVIPGRVFRNEALDASHENTFFQIEGMVVDKDVSVANMIFYMREMLKGIFKKDIEVRLRPGYFPFVEPGFELDAKCMFCGGKGCQTCKNGGWIELCPCGMIHPNVIRLGGLDPNKYSGFAFGLGFDRLVMMRTKEKDIRFINTGNLKIFKPIGLDI